MTPLTRLTAYLAQLDERAEKATPGKASLESIGPSDREEYKLMVDASADRHGMWIMSLADGDANFAANVDHLVATWNDLPRLVRLARALLAAVKDDYVCGIHPTLEKAINAELGSEETGR